VEVLKMLPKQSNHGFPETGKETIGKRRNGKRFLCAFFLKITSHFILYEYPFFFLK
jgi:hypothetical protein